MAVRSWAAKMFREKHLLKKKCYRGVNMKWIKVTFIAGCTVLGVGIGMLTGGVGIAAMGTAFGLSGPVAVGAVGAGTGLLGAAIRDMIK